MFQARAATAPGRRHKTVAVDFSNEFLRYYLREVHCRAHRERLDAARARVAEWAARSRAAEAARAVGVSADGLARPLAAVFDIDEVVLANIHANEDTASGFHAADYFEAPGGGPWPRGDSRYNPLMPGVRELFEELARHGVAIFFVTGRLESVRAETVANFVHVGLACEGPRKTEKEGNPPFTAAELAEGAGPLLLCADGEYPPLGESVRPYKERRRRKIEATHRIMLNVGDQASDLGSGDVQLLLPHPFYYIM